MADIYYRYIPLKMNLHIPYVGGDGQQALLEIKRYFELQNRGAAAQAKEENLDDVANRDYRWVRQKILNMAYLTQVLWHLHGGIPAEQAFVAPVGRGSRITFIVHEEDS